MKHVQTCFVLLRLGKCCVRVACSIDMFTVDLMRLSSVDDEKQKNHKGRGDHYIESEGSESSFVLQLKCFSFESKAKKKRARDECKMNGRCCQMLTQRTSIDRRGCSDITLHWIAVDEKKKKKWSSTPGGRRRRRTQEGVSASPLFFYWHSPAAS